MQTNKTNITIRNSVLTFQDQHIPLISGEVQYWRTVRECWEPVVDRAAELGLRVLSTYVPWVYHELTEGEYDFVGRTTPQRDLKGFITLLQERGIFLIVRPGPYVYGSMPNGGVPDRAAAFDRLDPEFLSMARDYMKAFAEIIRPHQITHGGNIILCQADNEPYPPIESKGTKIGCFEQDGMFKDWLRDRYEQDIGRLNAMWNTHLTDFSEAYVHFHEAYVDTERPMAERLMSDPATFVRYADTHAFIGWYAACIVKEAKQWLREAGIDIPVFANGWSPLFQDVDAFCKVADLSGFDIYPTPFFEGHEPVKDDWFYCLDILKLQQAEVTDGNLWSAEYQGGTYPPSMGELPPQHFRFANRVCVAHGLRGWNWYILTTRGNWSCNPVMEFGEKNKSFDTVAAQNRLAGRIEPWHCEPIYDLSLFCYKPHRVIDPGDFKVCFDLLTASGLSFDYWSPMATAEPSTRILLYAGGEWVDEQTEAHLLAFVENGGTLIAFRHAPRLRAGSRTPTALGFAVPLGARPVTLPAKVLLGENAYTLAGVGHMGFKINLFQYGKVPGHPIKAQVKSSGQEVIGGLTQKTSASSTFTMGYITKRGAGRIVHLGCNPSETLLTAVLAEIGARPACRCSSKQVQAILHRHESGHFVLYAINRTKVEHLCQIRLDAERNVLIEGKRWRVTDPDSEAAVTLTTTDLESLTFAVPPHDVAIRIIEPCD